MAVATSFFWSFSIGLSISNTAGEIVTTSFHSFPVYYSLTIQWVTLYTVLLKVSLSKSRTNKSEGIWHFHYNADKYDCRVTFWFICQIMSLEIFGSHWEYSRSSIWDVQRHQWVVCCWQFWTLCQSHCQMSWYPKENATANGGLNIQGQCDWRLANWKVLGQSGSSKRMYNVNLEYAGRKGGRKERVWGLITTDHYPWSVCRFPKNLKALILFSY
jgi:hypothetical protein